MLWWSGRSKDHEGTDGHPRAPKGRVNLCSVCLSLVISSRSAPTPGQAGMIKSRFNPANVRIIWLRFKPAKNVCVLRLVSFAI